MAKTQQISARIPAGLERAARAAGPELAVLERSALIRAALAVLAGRPLPDAISAARMPVGRPRTDQFQSPKAAAV